MTERFVIVTIAPVGVSGSRLHVYGLWPSRSSAEGEVRRMKKADKEAYPDDPAVQFLVRKILLNPGDEDG